MKVIKATVLARALGISRRTVSDWCQRDPKLAIRRGRDYFIRVDELAKKPGLDIVSVLTTTDRKWIKAIDLARWSEIPRRTIAYWCKTRPWFGRRIGRTWYVDLVALGATEDQAETLKKWAPNQKRSIEFIETASKLGNLHVEV